MTASSYPILLVSRTILDRTAALLRSFARSEPREGVVYWFGRESGQYAIVTTLIVPDAQSDEYGVRTTPEANLAAIRAAYATPLVLLGQAHSHPGDNVRHSEVDNNETFACFDGALSVVVPFFGRDGMQLGTCGVYRHMAGEFQEVPASDVPYHVCEVPGEIDLRKDIFAPPKPSLISRVFKRRKRAASARKCG